VCAAVVSLAACGADAPLQLLTGHVALPLFDVTPTHVRAGDDSGTIAAGLIDDNGRFVVAIPEGEMVIELVGPDGPRTLDSAEPIRVCAIGAMFDLGEIRPADPHCVGTTECESAQQELQHCEAATQMPCDQLSLEIDTCRTQREDDCGPLLAVAEDCESDCDELFEQADQCFMTHDCGPLEEDFWTNCLRPCDEETDEVEDHCAEPEQCESLPRVVPSQHLPPGLGCEGAS